MSWRPAGRADFLRMNRFLKSEEWKHVSLNERIRIDGAKPRFGQIADGRLWLKDKEHHISGALFISRFGVVLPAYNPDGEENEDREFIRRLLISRRDRLFSIIGIDKCVFDLEERLGEQPGDTESYRMFTGSEKGFEPGELPAGVTLHRASPSDMETLWPLEEAYQLEEVLRKGSILNERSGKMHFLDTLKRQTVFYASLNGRPVAKAGTNARGWDWDQVGGVFVIPELRGSGFARVVMERLLDEIKKNGKRPCLFVKTKNLPALGLYERLGFDDRGSFRISYWSP